MKTFEDKFMDIQAGMISLGMEYVKNQAENIYIYIYCISEDQLISFNIFFRINGFTVKIHNVNNVLANKIDDSDDMMFSVLLYGNEDIEKIIELCREYHRDHPTEMWLVYDAEKGSLDAKYSYEGRYEKDEELVLLPRKEFDKWFEEVKSNNL